MTTQPEYIDITTEPIDLNALQRRVTTPLDGSVVAFVGTVRGMTPGAREPVTERLEYEAYRPMARAKLAQVAVEMRQRFDDIHGIALVQRIGDMAVGEVVVAVVVSCGHRGGGAFDAARFGIDRLKQIVPVWKKETRPDGSSWVEGDYTPRPGD